MLKKIVRKIKSFFYALPFGMRGADELISTGNKEAVEISSQQQVEKKNVYQDLLNGEVTQEVEELRWQTYKVEELSNDYQYIGGGQAVKREETETQKKKKRQKFTQENRDIEYGLHESLDMAENADLNSKMEYETRKTFKIKYDNPCVRFKLEHHFEKVDIDLRKGIKTKFYFWVEKTPNKSTPLINQLKKHMTDLKSFDCDDKVRIDAYVNRQEMLTSIEEMEFTTFGASNNLPNGVYYKFKKPVFVGIIKRNGYMVMTFEWGEYEGGQLLSEKYYSKTGAEKYQNKQKKEGFAPIIDFNNSEMKQ